MAGVPALEISDNLDDAITRNALSILREEREVRRTIKGRFKSFYRMKSPSCPSHEKWVSLDRKGGNICEGYRRGNTNLEKVDLRYDQGKGRA